jgi:zinc protease
VATASPGHSLSEIDAVISDEIARLQAEGPTEAEMERAAAQAEAHFVLRLASVGGFGGKSDQLNAYQVFLGDPGHFERDLARYVAASADTLRTTAAGWLPPGARVALSVVPAGGSSLALAGAEPVVVA